MIILPLILPSMILLIPRRFCNAREDAAWNRTCPSKRTSSGIACRRIGKTGDGKNVDARVVVISGPGRQNHRRPTIGAAA